MPMSFPDFQLILAVAMAGGLVVLMLPLLRIVKYARLPSVAIVAILVPLVNVAWFSWVAVRRVRHSLEET